MSEMTPAASDGADAVPEEVARAATIDALRRADEPDPRWLDALVKRSLWRAVWIGMLVAVGLWAAYQARHLLGLLVVATFLALAMIPGVNSLHRRYKMKRGAAVGVIYLGGVLAITFMVAVLIPGIVRFAQTVQDSLPGWFSDLHEWSQDALGLPIDTETAADGTSNLAQAIATWGDEALGLVTSGLGLVFDMFTIAMFSFYIAASWPKIMRAFMSRMPPERQRVFGWVADESIRQTGGYFYSRLLLMVTCGGSGFVVMVLVGLPLVYALPLGVFMGFVSVFIPFIGTYLGAALPILITLVVQGLLPGIILLAWVVVYQQIENYWLSPRFSSHTMELNGAVAFGGAMAGGAIAGPIGAFMALPVAALITSIIKNSGRTYDVVAYHDEDDEVSVEPETS
ncbi:AI-2E family transporter [Demequina sp.]|uniref:AI-2E family transporter n=1 Tax=Demequina sp. TaxID=2050685 RepID=UPI0025D8347D|nr:AI-2E family transporter [Demequina sp.]